MGYISLTILSSFTLLVAFVLINGANASFNSFESGPNDFMQKRLSPAAWLKSYPVEKLKSPNSIRRDFQPVEVRSAEDSIYGVEKRFDDYGPMRFGKRGGGTGDDDENDFDDYGEL